MTLCHVCERPIEHSDRWCHVVLRNRLIVRACIRCWSVWPDEWKRGLA